MKGIGVVAALALVAPFAFAQTARGALVGKVIVAAEPVTAATVQAKELSTGKVFTATTARNGQFRIANLPPGHYEVSVPQIGLRTQRYTQTDVAVQPGQTRTLDIALPPYNQGVLGDDYGLFSLYSKHVNLNGPAPTYT